MSLYDHHSHERDIAINMLLEEALRWYFNSERARKHQITAITHPLLVGSANRYIMRGILLSYGSSITTRKVYDPAHRLFPVRHGDDGMQAECIIEIRHFLRDPRRAGRCYVDSGMYAALSLQVAKVIFEPVRSVRISSFLCSMLLMTLISKFWIDDYSKNEQQQFLRLAADTLPFYLEKGDYTSELADYLLSHTLDRGSLPKNYPNIQPLQDAIDFYLKVFFFSFLQYICHINFTG
jgi:hypothetical protein